MILFVATVGSICVLFVYLWLLATSSGNVYTKLQGMPVAFLHLFLSMDRRWKKARDAQEVLSYSMRRPDLVQRKRVYFIRHGESVWNEVFNRGINMGMLYRLVSSILQEIHLLMMPDSVFWDSPLSPLGIRQSVQLSGWLESMRSRSAHAALLSGDTPGRSILCVSNLRRAVSTILTGLSGRLTRAAKEQVYVVSSAQEITRNIDGYSLSEAGGFPDPSYIELESPELDHVLSSLYKPERFDGHYNKGNKSLFASNGRKRMEEFCDWAFQSEVCRDATSVVLGGHSLWFREFFKMFLPVSSSHESKSKKIVNCGIVVFDLITCGNGLFAIDQDSIEVVYGGFEENGKGAGGKWRV